jgi:nitroreductase
MDVFEAIERRQSIRRYRKDPVPEKDLERIMDSARRAPSGSNLQPWRFIIVREEATRQALRRIAKYNQWVEEAPVVIAALGKLDFYKDVPERLQEWVEKEGLDERLARRYAQNAERFFSRSSPEALHSYIRYNVAIPLAYITLTAVALGLGTCWINDFSEEEAKRILGVPEGYIIVALMTLGYPQGTPPRRSRLAIDEIVFAESFGKSGI